MSTSKQLVESTPTMPRTRGECADGPRPCPWVRCRHHLALDVTHVGTMRLRGGSGDSLRTSDTATDLVRSWIDEAAAAVLEMRDTCALDVAEMGAGSLREVGAVLNITHEGVRLVEVGAILKLRTAAKASALRRDLADA